MAAYILRRILLMIPTLFGIMAISFAVIQFAPGGPVEQVIAKITGQGGSDPATADRVLAEMTKMLVIVRPDTPEAAQKIEEIKAEFRRLYSPTGIFHTEGAVRVVE